MYTFSDDAAVLDRARQILRERVTFDPALKLKHDTDKNVRDYLTTSMGALEQENFHALYFDPHGRLVKDAKIGIGDDVHVEATPREVVRQGLLCNAHYVIVAHNHPSGDERPSDADSRHAYTMEVATSLVGIEMLVAYVVAGDKAVQIKPKPPESPRKRDALDDLMRALRGATEH